MLTRIDAQDTQRRVVAIEKAVFIEKDHGIAGKLPDRLELLLAGGLGVVGQFRSFVRAGWAVNPSKAID